MQTYRYRCIGTIISLVSSCDYGVIKWGSTEPRSGCTIILIHHCNDSLFLLFITTTQPHLTHHCIPPKCHWPTIASLVPILQLPGVPLISHVPLARVKDQSKWMPPQATWLPAYFLKKIELDWVYAMICFCLYLCTLFFILKGQKRWVDCEDIHGKLS